MVMVRLIVLTVFLLLLSAVLTGCNNLSEVSLFESESLEVQGDTPVSVRFIPASRLKSILDETLGSDAEVLFASDEQKETFVVFDPNRTEPVRMAQVRRIANSKGYAVVFLGLSTEHNPESITKVYSFEFGGNMPGYGLYSLEKNKFLQQFQGRLINYSIDKVDGITGATQIWRPVAEKIKEMAKNLVELKHDSGFLEYIKNNGKQWQRDLTVNNDEQIDLSLEQISAAASDGDWLFQHWRLIGMAEISIMVAGLFIVILSVLKGQKK